MKYLLTLLFVLSVSFASAQETNSEKNINVNRINNVDYTNVETVKSHEDLVISVKGVKKIEDIDIENFNKRTYLNLITSTKRKNITC